MTNITALPPHILFSIIVESGNVHTICTHPLIYNTFINDFYWIQKMIKRHGLSFILYQAQNTWDANIVYSVLSQCSRRCISTFLYYFVKEMYVCTKEKKKKEREKYHNIIYKVIDLWKQKVVDMVKDDPIDINFKYVLSQVVQHDDTWLANCLFSKFQFLRIWEQFNTYRIRKDLIVKIRSTKMMHVFIKFGVNIFETLDYLSNSIRELEQWLDFWNGCIGFFSTDPEKHQIQTLLFEWRHVLFLYIQCMHVNVLDVLDVFETKVPENVGPRPNIDVGVLNKCTHRNDRIFSKEMQKRLWT